MPQDNAGARDARETNAAIRSFLEYYVDPDRPLDYAVLIGGPWGSGKTYLVRRFLETTSAKPLYVSLYGMTSTSQIEEEFYRQLHPVLSHKGMRIAGSIAKAFAKGALKLDFNGDGKDDGTINFALSEIDLKKDLADPRDRLLVFDDLERCKMPIGEVLGFINGFVEHDGFKAIIIANETKVMEADKGYQEVKEKLIGQTLIVAAAADDAFDDFLASIADESTQKFLAAHRATVLELHAEGGRGNLRTLKHVMWDFEKVARNLEDRHWKNVAAVTKLMKGVIATAMENRAGILDDRILTRLLGNRIGRLMRLQNDKPKGVEDDIDARYPQVDFDDVCLPADVLAAVLLRGEVDGAAIRAAVDRSRDFAPAADQPLWSRAQYAFQQDDATAAAIVAEVEDAFATMAVRERGELMHLLGTRLWFSEIGMIPQSRADVLAEGLSYIDRIEEAGLIEVDLEGKLASDRDAFHGARVFDAETPEYRRLAEAYGRAKRRQEEAHYLTIALKLIERLASEPDEVLLDAVVNNARAAPYHDRPVLAAVPPQFFVDCVAGWDPKTQTHAIELLNGRHEMRHTSALALEAAWVAEVDRLLVAGLPTMMPMSRYRLQSLIDRNLAPLRPPPAALPPVPLPTPVPPATTRASSVNPVTDAAATTTTATTTAKPAKRRGSKPRLNPVSDGGGGGGKTRKNTGRR